MPPPTANKNIHPIPFRKILDLRMFNISLHFQRFTNRKPSVFDVSLWARLNLRRLSNNFGISSNGWSFSKKLSMESIESHHPVNTCKSIVNSSKLLFNNKIIHICWFNRCRYHLVDFNAWTKGKVVWIDWVLNG